jgi:RNA 2',3'-cyclic 3'-phosphodiesterase
MQEQLYLPGFERNAATDFLFFGLLLSAEGATQMVKLRERLCDENGLMGQQIAAQLLHVTLHGVGEYDGVPKGEVKRAKEAGAKISAKPFDVVFDRAMSFDRKRKGQPFVLLTADEVALVTLYQLLGGAMRDVGFRKVASKFRPHMTLLYGDRLVKERPIEPFRWTVRDFVLVQSLRGRGQSQYIHLARWPLRG